MVKTRIYPAIDIIDGNCVRLTKGDYGTVKIYNSDPLVVAKNFAKAGAEYLHVVDLDAAKNPEKNNRKMISSLISDSGLKIQTGGGIRFKKDVEELLAIGADRLIIGSVAVSKRQEVISWVTEFGSNIIIIGADVKEGKIATHGWINLSEEGIENFIEGYVKAGASKFLCTDISKDGMLAGTSMALYKMLLQRFPTAGLIASGGVTTILELKELIDIGMESIIVGKAIYEGNIAITDLFNLQS